MAIAPEVRDRIQAQLGVAYANAYPKTVEVQYPHVLEKISTLWGTMEMERFFEELLLTQRSDRKGFSTEAFGEILALIEVYRKLGLMKQPPKREGDVWSWVSDIGYEAGKRHAN
jgi:hypothetical protein